jgi:hypothetical protein
MDRQTETRAADQARTDLLSGDQPDHGSTADGKTLIPVGRAAAAVRMVRAQTDAPTVIARSRARRAGHIAARCAIWVYVSKA